MATIIEERRETTPSETRAYEKAAKVITGGAVGEGIGGAATIVLTILGLARLIPLTMAAVSGIVVGGALMWEGGMLASQFNKLTGESFASRVQFGSGMGAQFVGGAAGCVLSILALLGVYPVALVSIAAIVYGVVLAVSSISTYSVDVSLPWKSAGNQAAYQGGVFGAAGVQFMTGFAAAVLGILGLVGLATLTLDLVAMLCVGSAILLSGTAISARVFKSIS